MDDPSPIGYVLPDYFYPFLMLHFYLLLLRFSICLYVLGYVVPLHCLSSAGDLTITCRSHSYSAYYVLRNPLPWCLRNHVLL